MISGACIYSAVDIHAGCYTVNRISPAEDDLGKQRTSLRPTKGSEQEEAVIIDQLRFQLSCGRLSFSLSLSVLGCSIWASFHLHFFPSSDLPPSRLRINKSIRGWIDDAVRALSSIEGGNQCGQRWPARDKMEILSSNLLFLFSC